MCLDVHMSFVLGLSPIFMLAQCLTPSQTSSSGLSIVTRIILEIQLFTALKSLEGAVKARTLTGVVFLFELVAVVS